jgi:hypothetical protein
MYFKVKEKALLHRRRAFSKESEVSHRVMT